MRDHSLINMFCKPGAQVSLLGVQPGKHTLQIIPAANDHADDMKAAKQVSFVYKPAKAQPLPQPLHFAAKPQIQIVSPRGARDLPLLVPDAVGTCDLALGIA